MRSSLAARAVNPPNRMMYDYSTLVTYPLFITLVTCTYIYTFHGHTYTHTDESHYTAECLVHVRTKGKY